jgi:hypothetical protein
MKIGGLFSKIGTRKGTFLSHPLDSEWAAEIRWEGREREAAAGVEGGDSGAAIAAAWSSPALPKKALQCTI